MKTLWRLVLGLLLGIMMGVGFVATPVIFGLKDSLGLSGTGAGTLAGAMLFRLDVICLLGFASVITLELLIRKGAAAGQRKWLLLTLTVALALTILEMTVITPGIHSMRDTAMEQFGGISNAPDDYRAKFGILHGVSMIRALIVILLGLFAFVRESILSGRTKDV